MSIGIQPLGPMTCPCTLTEDAAVNRLWRALEARSITERVLEGLNLRVSWNVAIEATISRRMHSEVGSSWRFTTCAKSRYTVHVGRWALASTALIDVRHAVVDVGIPSLTDAEQEPIARSGAQLACHGADLVAGARPDGCAVDWNSLLF